MALLLTVIVISATVSAVISFVLCTRVVKAVTCWLEGVSSPVRQPTEPHGLPADLRGYYDDSDDYI